MIGKIDQFDIFILTSIHEAYKNNNAVNTWDMSKEYSKQIKEKDPNKIYKRIKARLNKYVLDGIFFIEEDSDGKKCFQMNLNEITIVKHKFSEGYGKAVLIRI